MLAIVVLAALTTAFTVYLVHLLIRWWCREDEYERIATAAIKAMDSYDGEDVEDTRHPNVVLDAVAEVRVKFGLLRDSKANRLIVFGFIREFYDRKVDMRRVDKNKFTPMAVELAFLPSDGDIHAYRVRQTRAYKERASAVQLQNQ